MKLFFDISNGKVVKPRTVPEFCAILDWRMGIKELRCCFSKRNIEMYGEEWKRKMLTKECTEWYLNPWLFDKVEKYIRKNFWKFLFRRVRDYEKELDKDVWVYLTFWKAR